MSFIGMAVGITGVLSTNLLLAVSGIELSILGAIIVGVIWGGVGIIVAAIVED